MAYIGKSPTGTGVRSRFYYTQTSGGGTSISGTDDNSKTLTFTDGEYIDVFLNGVLLVAGTDYNTNTANTISGLAALANGDVVEVVVYDIFTVADTVSASQGGTFNAGITANQVNADNIRIDGNTISSTDTNGDITLDPNGTGNTIVASGEVGVGTTTPATFTDYVSSSNAPSIVVAGSQPSYVLADTDVSGSSSTLGITKSGDSTVINNLGGGNIDFYNNGGHRMRVDSSGNVLVGTTATNSGYTTNNTGVRITSSGPNIISTGGGDYGLVLNKTVAQSGSTSYQVNFRNADTNVGGIFTNGSSTTYATTSDHRLKEAVVDMTGAIARVKQLAPKRFNFIADPDDTTVDGFLAHEAQTVVPEAVHGTHNEVDDDGNAVMQGIDQSKLVPLLTGALQEAIAKIETLETKVAALEAAE